MNKFMTFASSPLGRTVVGVAVAALIAWSGYSSGSASTRKHERTAHAAAMQVVQVRSDSLELEIARLKGALEECRRPTPQPIRHVTTTVQRKREGGGTNFLWAGVGLVTGLVIGHNLGDEAHAVATAVVNTCAPNRVAKKHSKSRHKIPKRGR